MIRIVFILASLVIGFVAKAQDLDKSLLWKISGNGLVHSSYLFGTIHAACEINLDKNTKKALLDSKQLYLEIDMDDPNMQAAMMKGIAMKNGVTISSLLSIEDAATLDAFLKENVGMNLKMVDKFKPFMISAMFIPKLLGCPMQSIETELVKIIKEQNKEVYGLETIENQLDVFDKIPYQLQADELVKTAKNKMINDKIELEKMTIAYNNEDIEGLLLMMKMSENKISSDYDALLLHDRNVKWLAIIERVSKEMPTFYGVGAGHLAGENGVIKLLRKKGFTVEAVVN